MLLNYKEVLKKVEQNGERSHLLLGNGFNNSLGVNTSYKEIYSVMKENFIIYKELELDEDSFDIEKIIGELKSKINAGKNDEFLKKFINNKVKIDFMKSAYAIVNSNIKNIYNEKNNGIELLFRNFTNFFTLNFDPLLYLLLMKYKKNDTVISFQSKLDFKIKDHENMEVQNYLDIYNNWRKQLISPHKKVLEKPLNKLTKVDFTNQLKEVLKSQGKKINQRVLNLAYQKLTDSKIKLRLNDGFSLFEDQLIFNRFQNQNVFFLHGAFHIYEKKNKLNYKITKAHNKALYQKIEEILDNQEEDLVCVFTNDNKMDQIESNEYLINGFQALSNLKGKLLIIGSSLDYNDKHVVDHINMSNIDEIYYSSCNHEAIDDKSKLSSLFSNKKITLFDRESISYN